MTRGAKRANGPDRVRAETQRGWMADRGFFGAGQGASATRRRSSDALAEAA